MESRITRHEPLYLKYRPQSLADLVGQESVSRTLGNAITYERLTHAYLFTGPRGTGKTSSARILAKSLNCERADRATLTPCQECAPCKEIKAGTSPAVLEIDAASNNSVDDARLLIERAPLKAVGGRYKIYIIDECHMLTKEAFNALLKTIEQPPPDVVFILATTEEHKVLPTIISRCQRLMFRNVDQDILAAHLRKIATKESIEIEDEALRVIARRSGGGLRDALSTLDQASLLGSPGRPVEVNDLLRLLGALHEDILLQISEKILLREGNGLLQSIGSLLAEGREPSVLAREIAAHFLNLAKASYLAETPNCTTEMLKSVVLGSDQYLKFLLEQAPKYDRSELSQIIEALDKLEATCRRTTQPTMHLEMGLLSICHRHEMLLVRELADRVAKLESIIQSGNLPQRAADTAPVARPPVSSTPPAVSRPPSPTANTPTTPVQHTPAPQPAPATPAPREVHNEAAPVAESTYQQMQDEAPRASAYGSPQPEAQQLSSSISVPSATAPVYDEPQPAMAEQDSAPYSSGGGSGGGAGGDIEMVWSRILDELHRINIPTHGFFNSRVAFLLDINDDEITFGVKNAAFQKQIEQKSNHIKAACKAVTGRDLNIRVKITAGEPKQAVAASASTRRPQSPAPAQAPSGYGASGGGGGSEPSYSGGGGSSQGSRQDAAQPNSAPATTGGASGNSDSSDDGGPVEFDNGAVKEAYKLFEGPGSRRIK